MTKNVLGGRGVQLLCTFEGRLGRVSEEVAVSRGQNDMVKPSMSRSEDEQSRQRKSKSKALGGGELGACKKQEDS